MICLYGSRETDFNNNGLVILSDCKSFYTTEKNNDLYEVESEYPLDSRGKWKYILEGNIAKNNDGQLFRIYHKTKTLTGIKANARHIFYDLLDNFIEGLILTNVSGVSALGSVLTNTQYGHSFINMSDISATGDLAISKTNPVDAILGKNGIIANYSGELERDNHTIKLLQARGLDRGVLVSYGKNIVGIEETIDLDSVITRIYPTGKDGLTLSEKFVDSQYIDNYPNPKVKEVQFSDIDNETDLRVATQNYFISTKCDMPIINYQVDFQELTKTEEYKNYSVLESIYMGDTVTVKHSKLKIDLKCKVISIKKNDLTNRIEKVELGNFKPNFATSLNKSIQNIKNEIVQVTSDYQKAIDDATALITGSSGGNVVIHRDETGKPYEILIMDTDDVMTAENVWRWNLGGFGYSSTGVNGPFDTAITMDGHIVASFIEALVISGEQIVAGTITSSTGKLSINLEDENLNINNKIVYDGGTDSLTFGEDVTLSWANQITDKPFIPSSAADVDALPVGWTPDLSAYVTSSGLNTTLVAYLTTASFATQIGQDYIVTGKIAASQIAAGTINGFTITGATITGSSITAINTLQIGATDYPKVKFVRTGTQSYGSSIYTTSGIYGHTPVYSDAMYIEVANGYGEGGSLTIKGVGYSPNVTVIVNGSVEATGFYGGLNGNVVGNVTGNCSGSSGSCTGNATSATSAGYLNSRQTNYATIPAGSSTTFYHNLGRIPIVNLSGSQGNLQLTYTSTTSSVTVYNYSSGDNDWSGYIYCW